MNWELRATWLDLQTEIVEEASPTVDVQLGWIPEDRSFFLIVRRVESDPFEDALAAVKFDDDHLEGLLVLQDQTGQTGLSPTVEGVVRHVIRWLHFTHSYVTEWKNFPPENYEKAHAKLVQ